MGNMMFMFPQDIKTARPFQNDVLSKRCPSRYPEYEDFRMRLTSLNVIEQPQWNPVEIRLLALEGFFNPALNDYQPGISKLKCFCCGLVANTVGNTNQLYQIHARNGGPPDGDCGYLEYVMGSETCFDKGGGEGGWQSCMSCRLCSWEFQME